MSTIDIILPTYRWGAYVRGYLRYLDSIISDAGLNVRLFIGDNSGNIEKHRFLRELSSPNIVLHLHPTNIGLYPNLLHLLNNSEGDLVLALGDDDWINPAVFAHAAYLDQNPECSACAGFLAASPPIAGSGMTCFDDRFMTPDRVGRAHDYVRYSLLEHGVNWLALGTHRRSTFAMYVDYTNAHPFGFYFRDQMLSQIALLAGPVKGLREGFTYYKNRTPEEMKTHWHNQCASLEQMGLAPWLQYYYHLLLACEYATLYLYRKLPSEWFSNRIKDADRLFAEIFKLFRAYYERHVRQFETHFVDAKIFEPMYAVMDNPSSIVGLRSLHAIISTMSPNAAERYARFLRDELVVDVFDRSN